SIRAPIQDPAAGRAGAAGSSNLANRSSGPYTKNPVMSPLVPRSVLAAPLRQRPSRPLPVTIASAAPAAPKDDASGVGVEAPDDPDDLLRSPAAPPARNNKGKGDAVEGWSEPRKGEESLQVLHTPKALAVPAGFIGWPHSPMAGK